ncbi:hypothetical protein [Pontibacillus marinus]|uniref:Uncharacterized protein n=1 Tax=Pontibacillus marinus BH030004 = DSM 16465 TaxID=1385511 RepID=A0A0A5FX62_9BACI|nr:hypothetical protein [Pontibacillus marinus]KGX85431.1 hypothetical protein N783_14675 [Pontibacillus marinus BH030004 = DSM 16465]
MSDRKKVIKVDDLVIYADNVFVEPRRRPHNRPPFDPFFGPRGSRGQEEEEVKEETVEEVEEQDEKEDDGRPPFSWI